jgi:transcriptional regulator with XRE-family HTH domain
MDFYSDAVPLFFRALEELGTRAKRLRIARGLTQADLAARTKLGVATISRFEQSGNTSIENAFRIAYALNGEEGFFRLFESPEYKTLDEALAENAAPARQRVRKSK